MNNPHSTQCLTWREMCRIPARQSRGVEEREVRQSLDRRPGGSGYGATVVKTDFMKHPNEKAEEESGTSHINPC